MATAEQSNEPRMNELEDVEVRLQRLAELLVHGATRADLIDMAMRRWQVSRRTAEGYAQTVRERLVGQAACTDRLFYLTLSQLQRDQLVGLALRYTMNERENFDPHVMQSLSAMITAVRGLLDSRDRCAAEIHQLVEEKIGAAKKVVRDSVADSAAARRATKEKTAGANGAPGEAAPTAATTEAPARNGKREGTPLPPRC